MERWFGNTIEHPFIAFGTSHITMLIIYFIGLIALLATFRSIRQQKSHLYSVIRWALLGLLIISEVSYQTWAAVNGVWNLKDHMPLHLCGIAGFVGILALITYHPKLIILNFFIGIIPAFLAVVTPELPFDFQHFRFWKFFVHHMVISWTSIFLILTSTVRIRFRSLLEMFGYLNVYGVIIYFINGVLGSNYLYLSDTPTADTPLDLLGNGIWYYINLEILAFSVFTLLYGIYRISIKSFSKNKEYQTTALS